MANIANYRSQSLLYSYKKVRITTADPVSGYVEGRDTSDQPFQITFTFFHSPFVQVPKVGEDWLITRLDNNWILHSRFEDGNEIHPAKELKGGDVRIAAPAHLLIDAQEIIMDFNKAAPSLAQLGTATIPGSAIFGDLSMGTASFGTITVDTIHITNKITTPIVSGLSTANLTDGQEERYLYESGDGIIWSFRYRPSASAASSGTVYPWEFIGGPDHIHFVPGGTATSSSGWINTSGSPTFTIPYSGEYNISGGAEVTSSANNMPFQLGLSINGSVTATLSGFIPDKVSSNSVNTSYYYVFNKNDVLREVYQRGSSAPAGTATFTNRWMKIQPIRVTTT